MLPLSDYLWFDALLSDVLYCRELAFQHSQQFDVLGKAIGIKTAVVVGGGGLSIIVVHI